MNAAIEEQIRDGQIIFDRTKHKIENSTVVSKSQEELLNEGTINIKEYKSKYLIRLRKEVERIYSTRTTPGGYSLDSLARQKAGLSLFYRNLPDDDPTKKDLLKRRIIYPNSITDEIMTEIEKIQKAYDSAKNKIMSPSDSNRLMDEIQSVSIKMFLK